MSQPAPSNKHPNSGWTEARSDRAKMLWLKGMSASQIAIDLGGVTKNAVIGRIARMGLKRDEAVTRITHAVTVRTRARAQRPESAPKPAPVRAEKPRPAPPQGPTPLMIPLVQLSAFTCKWPIGEPGEEGFGHCGNRTLDGKPYCGHHAAKAYEPATKKRSAQELIRSLRRVA